MRPSRLLPLIIATALFMENTDSTVIATSLPMIAMDIGVEPIALKLALTSYLVGLAIFIPVSGWMADRFGAKTIFTAALGVFMAGSLSCAWANSLEGFVFARFVQGMGGAMMVPVGRLVLLRSIPRNEIVQALATLTIPATIGPIFGPVLGGFITTYFDWRWIFFINIPIGILGIFLSIRFIPNIKEEQIPPLDIVGFLLSGMGLALLMMGFASGGHLVPLRVSIACVLLGTLCIVLFVLHARRTPHPVMKLGLFRLPTFRASIIGGSMFRVGIGAIPFLLPLLLQIGFGLSPLASGSLTFISAVGALFTKTLAKRVLELTGFRRLLIVNSLIGAAFIAINGLFTPMTPHWAIMLLLFAGGCFRSMQFTSLNAIAYADVSQRDMSSATSLSSVAQQVSLSTGVAIGAAALETSVWMRGAGTMGVPDFAVAFWSVAIIAALSSLVFLKLPPDAGAEMSGHRAFPRPQPSSGMETGVEPR
ncbi:DHA2 family efflux MFS transporter permease subunit [Microvirga antarctica]|uniref:DHA2 family efflux MFS transporter permease subunit n=1 Tax=Microvirga antarctica TaxID=2819233 RepID=UPI001B30F9CB|nr:DHA2 family efflux MFS transporter permease subunit [Microvirga antarctica]